ncbi:25604_t:CDS:2, partial [Dentiscutata erythropus]
MVDVVTRGESRKMKDRERKAAKRKDHFFQKSENNKIGSIWLTASDELDIPLCVLEMDKEFEKTAEKHVIETDDEDDSEHNLNNFINNNTINNASELRPSGILHVDDVLVTKKVLTLFSLQKLVEKSNQHSSNQHSSNERCNEVNHLICVPHECKEHYQTFTEGFDESDDDFNDDSDTDDIQNAQNLLNESFLVTFCNNKLTAVNLRVDYQFRGSTL